MNKPVKIFVSILLVISIILNPFSSFTASAVDPVTIGAIIAMILTAAAEGVIMSVVAYGSAELAWDAYQSEQMARSEYERLQRLIGSDSGIYFATNNSPIYYAYIYNGLTGEDLELAEFFCNYINERGGILPSYNNITGTFELTTSQYEKIKEDVINAYTEYCIQKINFENAGSLIDAIGLPNYSFGFVGPVPDLTFPGGTDRTSLFKDGFLYTIPFDIFVEYTVPNGTTYYYYPSKELAESAGATSTSLYAKVDSAEYWNGYYKVDCYGGGFYILYNGECYYYCQNTYSTNPMSRSFVMTGWTKESFIYYVSCDGVKLSDVYDGGGFLFGVVVNMTGDLPVGVPSDPVTDDAFDVTTGSSSFEIPRSDDEDLIGSGISAGLIGSDSTITFDEDGNIASVDGITIAKIEELIDLIASGNLEFEDLQQYLDVITTLITNGNLTASEQLIILGNLQSLVNSQSTDISDINEAVKSISEALTATGELILDSDLDIETPGISFIDKFPFCLPFDFYNILCLLCSQPKEPIF